MAIIDLGDDSAWSAGYDAANPSDQENFTTYLVRVAEDASAPDVEHPAILIVGSLHAFEWIGAEVALGYLDWLVQGVNSDDRAVASEVEALLEKAEFWFLVHGNVGGRRFGDVVNPACSDPDCEPGDPDDNLNGGQRKNMQWTFTTRDDASDYSQEAARSGYCDFATTGVVGRSGVAPWEQWGINVENNFSAVWPGMGANPYNRTAMLRTITPSVAVAATDYAAAGERAPELFACNPAAALGDKLNCATHFPDFFDLVTGGFHGGHTHCLQRGGTTIDPIYGCFMADPSSGAYTATDLASCQDYVDDNELAVTDELGIKHVCLRTEVSPGNLQYLLWECGTSGDDQSSIPLGIDTDATFVGPLLAYCRNGIRYSCASDADCESMPDTYFHPQSIHRSGKRYCSESLLCAVGYYRTPCSAEYRGRRPFEAVEARLLREVGDNVPFSFMVDMHATANDLSVSCKGRGNGCDGLDTDDTPNDEYTRVANLRTEMIAAYNEAERAHWQAFGTDTDTEPPKFLEIVPGAIDEPDGPTSGSEFPVWMSSVPVKTDIDSEITGANFDNNTYRGVTSFLWELGVATGDNLTAVATSSDERRLASRLVDCIDTDKTLLGGCVARSSLFLDNQLAGMKGMMAYLASEAETPNVTPPKPTVPWYSARRDVSLGGLRIHDGHGRGVQQLETRPDYVGYDLEAVTKIPAGLWAVEVDAFGGTNSTDVPTLSGDVTLLQWRITSGGALVAETESVTIPKGERRSVMRRFSFTAGERYLIFASVSGGDACVPYSSNTSCARANDRLVAKVEAVACDDAPSIPNGLPADAFCAQGLPFADTDFECNLTTGRCRECWLGLRNQQDCEDDEFCFEGMCDDADTCWSGTITDQYEGVGSAESSPTISSWSPPIVRTLHKQNPIGIDQQDVDSFFVAASTSSGPGLTYLLHVDVRELCTWNLASPLLPDEEIEGLQVRVQVPNVFSSVFFGPAVYENLTESEDDDWVGINRAAGLDVLIPTSASARLSNGRQLRIQVRNQIPDLKSMPYALDIDLSENVFHVPDLQVQVRPEQEVLEPTEIVEVDVSVGDLVSIAPTGDTIEDGYILFFKPAPGYENAASQQITQLLLVTPDGQVPTNDNGAELAQTVPRDGGLAIPLGALNPKLGPYEVRIATTAERVEGSVYLCSPNVDSCATFDPQTSTCGSACTGDGYRCCADQDRNYYCANLTGSDVLNCGACGNACDWDEKCLKGVCVKGKATSCWNTECPENTECVSKDLLFLRNPQCRATMVDRTWCGWFGTACSSTQDCVLGLCLPKMNVACGIKCLEEGQTCCWVNGVEQCVDVASSWARCGSCGNACDAGELCSGGKCEPWYLAADVCIGSGNANCSRTGISCKNLLNDPENCGVCGLTCPDRAWCENGQCMIEVKNEVTNVH